MGSATPLPSQKSFHVLITSSTSCTASAHSCTGMLARAWKRVSSVKLVKILQPSRKIMKRLALRLPRAKEKRRAMAMSSEGHLLSHAKFRVVVLACNTLLQHQCYGILLWYSTCIVLG